MRRREFMMLLGAGTAAWAFSASAQQAPNPVPPKEPLPDSAFDSAKQAVNAKLKDPESARYSDMVRKVGPKVNGKPAEVVCGKVNAKDSSGRYGAARPFAHFIADGATFVVDPNPQPEDVAQIIYGRFCK